MSFVEIERRVVACRRCPELRAYAAEVARVKRRAYAGCAYWGKPVPAFGNARARLLLVGLAPGAHGSNRTGRMFTGDASGDFLYPALYRAGFASQPLARSRRDGMKLIDCAITAAVRCAPPANRPTPAQRQRCAPYLTEELAALPHVAVVVGLGAVGFDAALAALGELGYAWSGKPRFGHGAEYTARRADRTITVLGSYHPSRQNTNTGVLTVAMFDAVFARARVLLDAATAS